MRSISYKRHRVPPEVTRHSVWLYFRYTLSLRDVEELLAQRGVEVSYETIRCWTLKFGRQFAHNRRRSRPRPTGSWHLAEMVVKIGGKRMLLWRAVDDEGEVLDMLVQERRNKRAALRLLRKLLRNQGVRPDAIITDKLASYRAAARDLGLTDRHQPGGMRENNRAENPHLPIRRRERKQRKFKSKASAQKFLATHAAVYNVFNLQPHLIRRPTLRYLRAKSHRTWAGATAAA
ncbi:MAG: IS6 family transposase [Caulobacter sp.]|nr:IS6 family transposase [Caulobacter sp.]